MSANHPQSDSTTSADTNEQPDAGRPEQSAASTTPDMGPGEKLKAWNPQFPDLIYQATGTNEGTVLNVAHEPPQAYEVDLDSVDCECQWMQQTSGHEVCKHVAKAMLAHPDFKGSTELLVRDLDAIVSRAHEATRQLEDADPAAREPAGQAAADAGTQPSPSVHDDPLAAFEDKLRQEGIPPENVDYEVHDEYDSINFEAADLDQDDFDEFVSWCQDTDGIEWDRDSGKNFIKPGDFKAVLG